jgi:signal transduction histidine kinase
MSDLTQKLNFYKKTKRLLSISADVIKNPEDRRKAEMISAILIGMIGCMLVIVAIFPFFFDSEQVLLTYLIMLPVLIFYAIALRLSRTRHFSYAGVMIIAVCLISTTLPSLNFENFSYFEFGKDEALRPVLFTPIALFFSTFIFGFRGVIITTFVLIFGQKMLLLKFSLITSETVEMLAMTDFITASLLSVFAKTNSRHTQQIHDQQATMAAAAKMSALGEMAGGIAHEINNPLAVIYARSLHIEKLLNRDEPKIEDAIKFAKTIFSMSERIAAIIKGMKTFSRDADSDPLEICSLKKIIEDTLILCEQRIKLIGVSLEIDSKIGDFWIQGKAVQISQVLLNLLNNSTDAIEHSQNKWITITAKSTKDRVIISVTDSGPGIPKAIREKMMDPFFTTKPVGKGTGLGLSVSRSILSNHNGSLSIDESCANTRFSIELPGYEKIQLSSTGTSEGGAVA